MELTIANFFTTVLPEQGVYVFAYRDGNFYKHSVLNDMTAVINKAETLSDSSTDNYFALASYTQGYYDVQTPNGVKRKLRTQDNADRLKCLFLDIDVGSDKPYKTTVEALQALKQFCVDTKLPTPTVVFSGSGGLHLYWALDKSVAKKEWRLLASRLHTATVTHNFHADPARTKDCASILRIPYTMNFKHGFPVPVLLKHLAEPQPYEFYETLLGGYELSVTKQDDFASILDPKDFANIPVLDIPMPSVPTANYPKRNADEVVAQCLQLQDQKGASEPIWRGMLATLRHCDGGYEMSHKLSKQDDRYNKEDTDAKIQQLVDKDIAPYTCVFFTQNRPEVCHKCPHQGKIKSPISVPTSLITTVEVTDDGDVQKVSTLNDIFGEIATPDNAIPSYDTGKYTVDETGCKVLQHAKGSDKTWWETFYPYPVYPIQIVKDRLPNGDIDVRYIFRKHHNKGYDDFQVKGDVLMGQGLGAYLGSVGFLLTAEERKHMAGFMIDLLKDVGGELEETRMSHRLGWDDDMQSFLLGDKLYKTSGTVVEVSPTGTAVEYSSQTRAKGDLEVWKQIANVYNHKGLEWGQLAVASAFASPLMPIGSLERAALLFLTGDKGSGKSTALSLAVSVFGNPSRMMINKDDTQLARLAKLGIMSNIAVGFDEMTDLSPKEASELAYQITQGRGKDRMMDGGKGIQHNTTYWSCLPIMSANDSIINALAQHSYDATAQMSRVLEVQAINIAEVYDQADLERCEMLVRKLPQNYGTAGDVYMRWVTANLDTVEEYIYRTEKRVRTVTKLTNTHRFWIYMCTRMLVGVMIANKLGLINYDVDNLFDYMVSVIKDNLHRMQHTIIDTSTLLGAFMAEHIGNRIVVTQDVRPKEQPFNPSDAGNDARYVITPLVGGKDLLIRIARKENYVYISRKAIADWCRDNNIPRDKFFASIEHSATVVKDVIKTNLGRQTQWQDTSRVECILLKFDTALDSDDDEFVIPDDDE